MAPGRRSDVQPVTWEIPVALAACWLIVAGLMLPAGRGAAAWLFGGGFVWPRGSAPLMDSLAGVLTGDLGRGLPPAEDGALASAAATYAVIGVGELLLVIGTVWAVTVWWRHFGPGVQHGMADRAEAAAVLGLANLRKRRHVIRPDLYGSQRPGGTW